MKMSSRRRLLAVLLNSAMLAACEPTHTQTVDTSLQSFRPIGYSTRDTCETQKQIAAHNSVYDTLKSGRSTVYQALCDRSRKAAPQGATS